MMNKSKLSRNATLQSISLFCLIAIMTLGLFLFTVGNPSVWLDEVFTLDILRAPLDQAIEIVLNDVHPPLYYIMLRCFVDIISFVIPISDIILAKWFSIVPIVIQMVWMSVVIKKDFGYRMALIALLLIYGTRTIMYAVEIRSYSWTMLWVTMAYLYGFRVIKTQKRDGWIIMTICALLGAYTHYYAVIALSLLYLFLLYHCAKQYQVKPWIICMVTTVFAYVPWLFVLKNQLSGLDGVWQPSLIELAQIAIFPFYTNEMITTVLVALIALVLVIGSVIQLVKHPDTLSRIAVLAQSNVIYVAIIGIIISLIVQKFFTGKYLLCGWIVFWIGIAFFVDKNLQRKWVKSLFTILVLLNGMTYIFSYSKEDLDRQGYAILKSYVDGHDYVTLQAINDTLEVFDWDLDGYHDIAEFDHNDQFILITYDFTDVSSYDVELVQSTMLGGSPICIYQKE